MGSEPQKDIKYYRPGLYMQLILTNGKWEVCEMTNEYNSQHIYSFRLV
jgi:hypothetical protein